MVTGHGELDTTKYAVRTYQEHPPTVRERQYIAQNMRHHFQSHR